MTTDPRNAGPSIYYQDGRPIGGWLYLVRLELIVGLVLFVLLFASYGLIYGVEGWSGLIAVMGGEQNVPLAERLFLFELVGNALLMILQCVVFLLFELRKSALPMLYIILCVANMLFIWSDLGLQRYFDVILTEAMDAVYIGSAIWATLWCAIWVPYMIVSKRVRETFVR